MLFANGMDLFANDMDLCTTPLDPNILSPNDEELSRTAKPPTLWKNPGVPLVGPQILVHLQIRQLALSSIVRRAP